MSKINLFKNQLRKKYLEESRSAPKIDGKNFYIRDLDSWKNLSAEDLDQISLGDLLRGHKRLLCKINVKQGGSVIICTHEEDRDAIRHKYTGFHTPVSVFCFHDWAGLANLDGRLLDNVFDDIGWIIEETGARLIDIKTID